GWAAYTPLSIEYAIRTFYRPAIGEQPEWDFDEDSPMPEVQALLTVLREYRPDLIFSLHNHVFTFPTVAVTDDVPGIVDIVAQAAAHGGTSNSRDTAAATGLNTRGGGVLGGPADNPLARIAEYASRHRSNRATLLLLEGPMWRGRGLGHTVVEVATIAEIH